MKLPIKKYLAPYEIQKPQHMTIKLFLILSLAFVNLAWASKENVTIIYAFGSADTIANYGRMFVEEANKIQNKYVFLFDTKPGAGNAIAANHVINTPNTVLQSSSSFFIRPIFFPKESYAVTNFRELLPLCESPMSIASAKFQNWKEIPTDRPVTIGVSGLGTTTHLVALQLSLRFPKLQVVPFKSPSEGITAVLGGQIDLTVGFLNDTLKWSNNYGATNKKLHVLGVTGTRPVEGIATLISQGFPAIFAETTLPNHLLVPVSLPEHKFQEWRKILFAASKARTVRDAYAMDYCSPLDSMPDKEIQPWFDLQTLRWKLLSKDVKLEQ